jgi:type IV secretion system protein VirD4
MPSMTSSKMESATKMKIFVVVLIIVFDLVMLPWILKLPVFLIGESGVDPSSFATAPSRWLEYGLWKSIQAIFNESNFRNLYLFMQIPVFTLIIAITWNVDKLSKKNRVNDGVGGPDPAGSGQHGTSRWQNKKEMDQTTDVWHNTDEIEKSGIIFGMEKKRNGKEKIWSIFDDLHTLIIGATRSGKSRKVILPSIWGLAKAGESMVIGDPKGELYISTKEYLEEKGYDVISLNLREPLKGNQWNMLDLVNKAVDDGDVPRATELAWDIASAITNQKPSTSSEPIWQNGEESTIASLILLTALESEFVFQRHMTTAYYLLAEYGQPLPDDSIPLLDYISKLDAKHPAKSAFATASIAPYKTRASFFTTALSDLRLFADPNISDMTLKQDHSLEDIGIKKTAVFLIVPDEKTTRNVLATLYVDQVYQAMVDLANRKGGRIPRRVNFILDEFGNLPPIPSFDKKLTVAGGRGMRFTIAVQDIAQLKKLYKENSQTITGNCHNWIYIKTADVETAKLISEKTGKYTVETENSGSSVQAKGHSRSLNVSLTGRPLLMTDEVLRWDTNQSLIIPVSYFPARYPLPDLSLWKANEEFGFTSPSGNLDRDKQVNTSIIERRWNEHIKREYKEVSIWLPDLNEVYSSGQSTTRHNIPPAPVTTDHPDPQPSEENSDEVKATASEANVEDLLQSALKRDMTNDEKDDEDDFL